MRINEIKNETYKEAIEKMADILYELNIPKRASKKRFEEAKKAIEEIAQEYNIECDVDYWINRDGETPKNGFQVLNMKFDGRINHLVYNHKPYERKKKWLIYGYKLFINID